MSKVLLLKVGFTFHIHCHIILLQWVSANVTSTVGIRKPRPRVKQAEKNSHLQQKAWLHLGKVGVEKMISHPRQLDHPVQQLPTLGGGFNVLMCEGEKSSFMKALEKRDKARSGGRAWSLKNHCN